MKLALVGHGGLPIPPPGWGAVEIGIWHQAVRLRERGHTVDIYNSKDVDAVVADLNSVAYDFIHVHNPGFVAACGDRLRGCYAVSSHDAKLYRLARLDARRGDSLQAPDPSFLERFGDTLSAPANFVLSHPIAELYRRHGYAGYLGVLPNAVETDSFRIAPVGNGRTICLGKIQTRKRQGWLARTLEGRVPIDFVGPWNPEREPDFVETPDAVYLGPWSKDVLYERLTEYSCLVLLSSSESAPRVVLEALAAGVSVVISEASAANLVDAPFITVLPDSEDDGDVIADAITDAIARNTAFRPRIRAYTRKHLDCEPQLDLYLRLIEEFRASVSAVENP